MARRSSRAQLLAFRAAAMLAVLAALGTGAIMALSHAPQPSRRGTRHRTRVIAARDAATGAVEPVATVVPPEEDASAPSAWPPPLLNPSGHLRMAWDLSLGRPNSHEILFSFDDGPNPGTTDRLLTILARARIHALFFVCGWRLEAEEPLRSRARQILRDIVAGGHVVGNHTVHHRVLPQLSPAQVSYEIDHNAALIEEIIGQRPFLFRPPYGAYGPEVRRQVVSRRDELWLWSIDSRDWQLVGDSDAVAQRVITEIGNHAGGTVLLHDTHPWSVNAVPKILRWINETNLEREAEGRRPYVIADAARYLEGARARLPLLHYDNARADEAVDSGMAIPSDAAADAPAIDARTPADVPARDAGTPADRPPGQ